MLYKEMICARSTFFQAACAERWNESKTPIRLAEDDCDTFDVYLYCMCTGKIDLGDLDIAMQGEEQLSNVQRAIARLVSTYLLADELGDIPTANAVIKNIISHSDETRCLPGPAVTAVISRSTMATSPLGRLFVDYYVHETPLESTTQLCENDSVPKSFICEILQETQRLQNINSGRKIEDVFLAGFARKNICRFQQHGETYKSCGLWCKMKQ